MTPPNYSSYTYSLTYIYQLPNSIRVKTWYNQIQHN